MINHNPTNLTMSVDKNLTILREHLHRSSDLVTRTIKLGHYTGSLLFIDGIVNTDFVQECIITPLLALNEISDIKKETFIEDLSYRHIRTSLVEIETSFELCALGILKGKTLILFEGFECGILAETTEWKQRTVEQSLVQRTAVGPMHGFNEQMKVNINLIRNMVQTPYLCIEVIQVGTFSKSDIAITYIKGKVDQSVLDETKKRLSSLEIDYVLEARMVEDAIEGRRKTIFPLTLNTERPDVVASGLYEGRIAILVNGTPNAMVVPSVFIQYFQSPDDYYMKSGRYTNRIITFLAFCFTIFLPGLYLAIEEFHQDFFPKKFEKKLFTDLNSLPPAILEVLIFLVILQMVQIASVRVPKEIVVTVALVGAIVLSETAVNAKLIHPISLVVVGLTILANYLVSINGLLSAVNPLRLIFLLVGNFFGFTGMGIVFALLIIYMAKLQSVSVPYLAPIIPFRPHEFKDVFYRGNLKKLTNSPHKYPHNDKE
ncbi:spore gernimation protein GerA [Bacillus sp. AFS001701]|uniref:spore germination protein n=1 Tax=Bacillaceae TaxID=186817 RepID=UPI000BF335AF|nr:spore germination protein [Bacillus sp. AFS001701]PET71752.1 spore gernimation protein GerA [Bacillus sp. AFS001701]